MPLRQLVWTEMWPQKMILILLSHCEFPFMLQRPRGPRCPEKDDKFEYWPYLPATLCRRHFWFWGKQRNGSCWRFQYRWVWFSPWTEREMQARNCLVNSVQNLPALLPQPYGTRYEIYDDCQCEGESGIRWQLLLQKWPRIDEQWLSQEFLGNNILSSWTKVTDGDVIIRGRKDMLQRKF